MAKQYRPDLYKRVLRVLADPSLERISALRIAEYVREPAEDVWACLKHMDSSHEYVVSPLVFNTKRSTRWKLEWAIVRENIPSHVSPLYMKLPEPEPPQKPMQCPGCGKPLKRRHGRREIHDPHLCGMDNLREIMGN